MAQRYKRPGYSGVTQWWYELLTVERPWKAVCAATVLAAAIFAAVMLGWGYVAGTSAYWQHPLYDAGAHLSGWLFYKEDSWRFPLFETIRMAYPDGVSIILTDSIPLLAVIAKALGLGLLGNWHYFGLFVFGSYVLNSVALLWLLRQLGVSNVLGGLCAVVFACCTTLYNLQFESFFAHFFVIFSLGFYFRLTKQFSAREMGLFAAMVAASLLVHPYLFAMSAVIFGVTVLQLWRNQTLRLPAVAMWLGGFVAAVGVLVAVSGYLAHGPTGYQEHLYGKSSIFALDLTAVFDKRYTIDEIGTYVGFGFWVLAALGVWLVRQKFKPLLKSHGLLLGLGVVLLLFSISNTILWNGRQVLHIDLPQVVMGLLEMFRASKRFIMPLYYLVVVAGLVLALRSRRQWAAALVVLALVLQVVDTSYFVQGQYAAARQAQPTVLDEAQLRHELSDVEIMHVFPSYSCLFNYRKTPLSGQWVASLELYQVAAREHKISNSIRSSRRTQDCNAETSRAQAAPQRGSLHVYLKDDNKVFILQPPAVCLENHREFIYGIYCKAN